MILSYVISGHENFETLFAFLTRCIDIEDEILSERTPEPRGKYVFHLNSTEIPDENLLKNLKMILEYFNPDIVHIPRVNLLYGYTQRDIEYYNLSVDADTGWVNWPDYQGRIHKRGTLGNSIIYLFPHKKWSLTCLAIAKFPRSTKKQPSYLSRGTF